MEFLVNPGTTFPCRGRGGLFVATPTKRLSTGCIKGRLESVYFGPVFLLLCVLHVGPCNAFESGGKASDLPLQVVRLMGLTRINPT